MTCWEALGKEEFFLPHLPKEKKSYLRSLLSHMMKWKIANRVNFFLYWTKSLCYNKEHYYFCFLVWWWHKVSQTIPLGWMCTATRAPFTHTMQRGVVTDGWTKGQQAAELLLLQHSTETEPPEQVSISTTSCGFFTWQHLLSRMNPNDT